MSHSISPIGQIEKVSDIPVRWYTLSIRGGQKFEIDEATAELFIKAEKIVVLRDKTGRLIRYINKADVSEFYFNKEITKENYQKLVK